MTSTYRYYIYNLYNCIFLLHVLSIFCLNNNNNILSCHQLVTSATVDAVIMRL